jgi:hypothetical protein
MQERDDVLHDIHGVASMVEESPALVEKSLNLLEQELSRIPQKSAFIKALSMSPEYVQNRSFRLLFLRAAQFDAKDAARRMVGFFEQKLRVFGSTKLTTKIRLSELDEDTIAYLETGYIQLLPGKDRAGRGIITGIAKLRKFSTEMTLVTYHISTFPLVALLPLLTRVFL